MATKPRALISTIDNPYNPWTDYDKWNQYDERNGYFTNQRVARLCLASNQSSDIDYEDAIEDAQNKLIDLLPGLYKLVYKPKK